ncbi:NAD(P)-binding domain-containing protein [Sphingobacterium oryzagri]|uniref:NAD(P)-binding domain-containing protein n=1 Tax=Sphingobacterium oryzagri TaxID=3025669 RepID=A0ABY7WF88_9SPHI|nr:NAD(P)-binding domain-containing protein [Sphingobacterium sp. KACC 22765]WDF67137.1 NAD(P)-binding domain-containing protein [Sphingobacterium sp. KACC 22765]
MKTNQTVAIIGLGNIGQAIGNNLSKSQREFIAADRNTEKAANYVAKWGNHAKSTDINSAIKEAGIIVLSIPYEAISPFIAEYRQDLQGKIVIDPSNPIAPDENGGFKKIIEQNLSAGVLNHQSTPEGIYLVKALGTLGVDSLNSVAYQTPQKAILFYASDDSSLDQDVESVIHDLGFEALKVGGIESSSRIEVFGDLHEFGALGKPVNMEEAKSKL